MIKIKVAVVGVGNCASSLIQGIEYYRHKEDEKHIGLMHYDLGGYKPQDIGVVAAFESTNGKWGRIWPKPSSHPLIVRRFSAMMSPPTGSRFIWGG